MSAQVDRRMATPRLSPALVGLMLAGALGFFVVAYAVGALFGRAADRGLGETEARVVPALEPSGAPLLTLVARSVAFDVREIRIPASGPVRIRVENEDAGILHNIAVYRDERASDLVVRGALFDGPRTRDYVLEPLPAGSYYFQCDLHPTMNGTLTAE